MVRSISFAHQNDRARFKSNMIATIVLGLVFLIVKSFEYTLKISHGYYPGSEIAKASPGLSIFLSYYYAMTILHALHIVVGLIWNAVVLYSSRGNDSLKPVTRKAEFAGLYWHFVDVVWVFLFPLLYLI
jgi:cytochrome c oxidase subunit 3